MSYNLLIVFITDTNKDALQQINEWLNDGNFPETKGVKYR
jgi:hypothetical protein